MIKPVDINRDENVVDFTIVLKEKTLLITPLFKKMNFQTISLLVLLNFASLLISAEDLTSYYCANNNWKLSGLTEIPRCYQKLPAIFSYNLTAECQKVGGFPINIESYVHGTEVIEMMKYFKYYGIWVDARQNGNSDYKWIDGRAAPNPMSWCSGISKVNTNLVIVCPYPKAETYSMSTCCLSDRHDRTKWVAMCETFARTDCQYVETKRLKTGASFDLIGSTGVSGNDAYNNEECCQLCARTATCSVFEYNSDTSTCYFYKKNIRVKDINAFSVKDTSSWLAGAPYIRLDK